MSLAIETQRDPVSASKIKPESTSIIASQIALARFSSFTALLYIAP